VKITHNDALLPSEKDFPFSQSPTRWLHIIATQMWRFIYTKEMKIFVRPSISRAGKKKTLNVSHSLYKCNYYKKILHILYPRREISFPALTLERKKTHLWQFRAEKLISPR
jgi:hypothetical protein